MFILGSHKISPACSQGFFEDFQTPDSYLSYAFDIRKKFFCNGDGSFHTRPVHFVGPLWTEFSNCDSNIIVFKMISHANFILLGGIPSNCHITLKFTK